MMGSSRSVNPVVVRNADTNFKQDEAQTKKRAWFGLVFQGDLDLRGVAGFDLNQRFIGHRGCRPLPSTRGMGE